MKVIGTAHLHKVGFFVFRFLLACSNKFYLASNSIVEQRMLANGVLNEAKKK